MNVAFFLTPKQDVVWIPAKATMRQALERMEFHHYAAVPVLDEEGRFAGVLTEGDLLWMMKHNTRMTFADTEHVPIADVPRLGRPVHPVHIHAEMEELFALAATQNFVPVVDDSGTFIGIVRRSTIIDYTVARLPHAKDAAVMSERARREDWICLLDAAGVVLGVGGGAPPTWVGRPFAECPGVNNEGRTAARKLLAEDDRSRASVRRKRLRAHEPGAPDLTLVAHCPPREDRA